MKYFKMEEFECRCYGKVRFTENIEALVVGTSTPYKYVRERWALTSHVQCLR